jgi:hypothetical protein
MLGCTSEAAAPRFDQERHRRIVVDVSTDGFDGDFSVQPRVRGEIDHAHPAVTQHTFDAIGSQERAGGKRRLLGQDRDEPMGLPSHVPFERVGGFPGMPQQRLHLRTQLWVASAPLSHTGRALLGRHREGGVEDLLESTKAFRHEDEIGARVHGAAAPSCLRHSSAPCCRLRARGNEGA